MEDYKVIKAIGKGSFGKVYLVRHVNEGRSYVLKARRCARARGSRACAPRAQPARRPHR